LGLPGAGRGPYAEVMILVIDNYDSFVYNLVQYLGELGCETVVRRNDGLRLEDVESLGPTHVVVSPGPCTPLEAGLSNDVIGRFGGRVPILGVCLGHQCIGHVYGGHVDRADRIMHGKTSVIAHDGRGIFLGVPSPFQATRYHSLVVREEQLPACLEVSARSEWGEIMALRHRAFAVDGVQFHPESILTEHGHQLLRNFLAETSGQRPS